MSTDRYCEQLAESLSARSALSPDAERHIEHCPRCAGLARLPALIEESANARPAIELAPGFLTRTVARSSARLAHRRRTRVVRHAALAACATLAIAGTIALAPRMLEDAERVSATRPTPDTTPDTTPEPVTQLDESTRLDQHDLSRLSTLSEVDRSLSFRADWRAAGGQVSAEDIADASRSLELTPQQEKALRRIITQEKKEEIELRARIDKARVDLHAQLESDDPDEKAVARAIERISELEAQVRKVRVLSWLKARKLLNADQRRRLTGRDRHRVRRAESAEPVEPVHPARPAPPAEPHRDGPWSHRGHDADLDMDMDLDLELDIDIDTRGFEDFDQMERMLDRALEDLDVDEVVEQAMEQAERTMELQPELEEMLDQALEQAERQLSRHKGLSREEMERARDEIRRAREDMRKELERARRELEQRRPELERMRSEARREVERARREIMKAREDVRRRVGEAGREAERDAHDQ